MACKAASMTILCTVASYMTIWCKLHVDPCSSEWHIFCRGTSCNVWTALNIAELVNFCLCSLHLKFISYFFEAIDSTFLTSHGVFVPLSNDNCSANVTSGSSCYCAFLLSNACASAAKTINDVAWKNDYAMYNIQTPAKTVIVASLQLSRLTLVDLYKEFQM